jgi:hypothetical protein
MLLLQGYLSLTVLMFVFSPWEYPVDDPLTLYGFLALVQASLMLGYLSYAWVKQHDYTGRPSLVALLLLTLTANLILLYPTAAFRTSAGISAISAFEDPGEAYRLSQLARESAVPTVEYVRIALGPILGLLFR